MSGVKGRGGRPPLTLAELKAKGTFRPDRHAHLLPPDGPRAVPSGRAAVAVVPDVAPLDEDGAAFEHRMRQQFTDWSAAEETTLRLAAQQIDRLIEVRTAIAEAGVVTAGRRGSATVQTSLLRIERQTTLTIATLLRQLNLRD